jgi:hypothetical protein
VRPAFDGCSVHAFGTFSVETTLDADFCKSMHSLLDFGTLFEASRQALCGVLPLPLKL